MVVYEWFLVYGFEGEKFGVLDRWLFTTGCNYRDLRGKNLVFWIGGCLRKVPTKRVLSGINLVFWIGGRKRVVSTIVF